jgi:hypothetical protein
MRFPRNARKSDRSGPFPVTRVSRGCVTYSWNNSSASPHANPSVSVRVQLRSRVSPTSGHANPRTHSEIHPSASKYDVLLKKNQVVMIGDKNSRHQRKFRRRQPLAPRPAVLPPLVFPFCVSLRTPRLCGGSFFFSHYFFSHFFFFPHRTHVPAILRARHCPTHHKPNCAVSKNSKTPAASPIGTIPSSSRRPAGGDKSHA